MIDRNKVKNDMVDSMWSFLQMGGLKANYPALKNACMELRQMMMQKTAGQRSDRPKDLSWDNLERVQATSSLKRWRWYCLESMKENNMSEKIKAYKAMTKDMTCRGKQYEVGKTYVENKADCCNSGMHACTDPFDVLRYYRLGNSRLFEVECGGDVSKGNDDSKIACTEMTVKGELNLFDFVKLGIKAVFEKAKDSQTATTGDCSTAATTGDRSTAATTGYSSTAATTGDCSTAATTGYCSTAATTGDRSTAATTGDRSTAATTGDYSTAATTGDYSTAATTGYCSTAATTGYSSTAKATGKFSIAVANGYESKASGSIGNYLVLTEYDDYGNLICAKMEQVDGERIKENALYMLNNGEFVEVE